MGKQLFIKLKVRCSDNIKINLRGVMEDIYCKIKGMYMYMVRTVLASMAICSWKTFWVITLYKKNPAYN